MISSIKINKPCTLKFNFSVPAFFLVIRKGGNVYYSIHYNKFFGSPKTESKVNISDIGEYTIESDSNFKVEITDLQEWKGIDLPAPQYDKRKRVEVRYNPNMKGTPARINVATGVIEVNDFFNRLPIYAQKFIMEHEKAHLLYKSEWFTDLYAFNSFMKKGGNVSSALTTLQCVLKSNPLNSDRLKNLIGAINS